MYNTIEGLRTGQDVEQIAALVLSEKEQFIDHLQTIADLKSVDATDKVSILNESQKLDEDTIGMYTVVDFICAGEDFNGSNVNEIFRELKIEPKDELKARIVVAEYVMPAGNRYGCSIRVYPIEEGEEKNGFEIFTYNTTCFTILEPNTGSPESLSCGPKVIDVLKKRDKYINRIMKFPEYRIRLLNELVVCFVEFVNADKH